MSSHEQLTWSSDDRRAEIVAEDTTGDYDASNNGDDQFTIKADNGGIPNVDEGTQESKKKRKKKKSRTKKRKKPVTGFEEFYADSPLTPTEAILEQEELYSKNRLFIDRIEECIQRYRARRKMDNEQTSMFNKYMFLGGVDSEQRQFTGIAEDIERLAVSEDKDSLRIAMARDFVGNAGSRFYEPGSKDWVVDFEGVVKGFLSRTMTDIYLYDDVAISKASALIKNFLNYVLTHDVCPEYRDGVLAARHICDIAPSELRAAYELANKLPGAFHRAAADVFPMCTGGSGNEKNATTMVAKDIDDPGDAEKVMKLAVVKAALGSTPETMRKTLALDDPKLRIRAIKEREQTYIVTKIERPLREARQAFIKAMENLNASVLSSHKTYSGQNGTMNAGGDSNSEEDEEDDDPSTDSLTGKAGPVGVLTLRLSYIEGGYDNIPTHPLGDQEDEAFILEDSLLRLCEIGMKLQLVVSEFKLVSVATETPPVLRIIKACSDVRVSFDTFLPQMLMGRWRDPVDNSRPAPSVHNPHAEAEVAEDDGDGENDHRNTVSADATTATAVVAGADGGGDF
ncbi:Argonaute complex, subunit Arb1 [Microdochium bolleyi]|uniref:Argonaute complex, subunit Arb1 n=1 Tax=Microdochium bolleyi TaxID=196109 RepID=A0A136IMI6_9PEZI|nr:Argonaute complex, subunit Arb1 [Microdochium bolleyi]